MPIDQKEAASDAFVDNHGSNAISQRLGYEPNGPEWATRQGDPALLNRWRLTRDTWERRRRGDIQLHNVEAWQERVVRDDVAKARLLEDLRFERSSLMRKCDGLFEYDVRAR